MAKTIMVSNEVYNKLKKIKEMKNESFSEVILESIKRKEKTVADIRDAIKRLSVSSEDKKIENEIREGWNRWNKRKYV